MKSFVVLAIAGLAFAAPVVRRDVPAVNAAATAATGAYKAADNAVKTAKTADQIVAVITKLNKDLETQADKMTKSPLMKDATELWSSLKVFGPVQSSATAFLGDVKKKTGLSAADVEKIKTALTAHGASFAKFNGGYAKQSPQALQAYAGMSSQLDSMLGPMMESFAPAGPGAPAAP